MPHPFSHSGTRSEALSQREKTNAALAREAAGRGIVLLKNSGVLPLAPGTPIALLGSGASRTVKGGTGSGDVNSRENRSIYEGLKKAGAVLTSEDWIADYEARYTRARLEWRDRVLTAAERVENPFDAYAANPFCMPHGRPITGGDLKGAKAVLYVLSRISGEGRDRRLEKGDYDLSDREWADLRTLDESGLPVILLVNAGGPVELTDLLEKMRHLAAVLQLSQLGQQGGLAAADVLFGTVVPEGKLTATWPRRYDDLPCARQFGSLNGDVSQDTYREGIYVGYRYFDTFGVRPLFAFGYGLSYTSFDLQMRALRAEGAGICVDVQVTNTGSRFSGREVVQVYLSCPQNGQPRERRRLAGFSKTRLLHPGEGQTVAIHIPQKQLASFRPEQNAWVVDQGLYGVWIGNSSDRVSLCGLLQIEQAAVLERTHPICPVEEPFEELGQAPGAAEWEEHLRQAQAKLPVCRFMPAAPAAPAPQKPPRAEGPVEALVPLLFGNVTQGASTLGSSGTRVPGSAGETSRVLEKTRGVPGLVMADGPAGLRLRQHYEVDRKTGRVYGTGVLGSLENGFLESPAPHADADTYYQFCTAFPVGTALAQTWDTELLTRIGRAVSREMEEFHVDLWLAPGMNLQRNPLCGRNFEYFSEDPLLSGILAAAITRGVQASGRCGVTLKHFACNNQEDNRMAVDARVSERALRELYLRGFEIAVKAAAPAALMTAYNCVNGIHASNSRDLCTVLLRQEWGFDGLVLSDWNTTVPLDGSVSWKCAWAGNDVIMPGNPNDEANIRQALADGRLSEGVVRLSAGRVLALVQKLRG